jgi:hypothetical protein
MLFLALFGASFFMVSGVEARVCSFEDISKGLDYCIFLGDMPSTDIGEILKTPGEYCMKVCRRPIWTDCQFTESISSCRGSDPWKSTTGAFSNDVKFWGYGGYNTKPSKSIIRIGYKEKPSPPPLKGEGCYCVIDEKTKEQGLIIGFSETMAMKTECSNKKGTQLPSGKLLGECAWLTSPPSPVVSASATTTASAEVEQKIGFNSKVLTEISGLNRLKATDLPRAIGLFVQWAMGMLGSIALVLLIYAGVLWMTAAGNAERTKKSQDIMIWAALGLIVIFSSYGIINFVLKNLS